MQSERTCVLQRDLGSPAPTAATSCASHIVEFRECKLGDWEPTETNEVHDEHYA
jgi:hypothetical protein